MSEQPAWQDGRQLPLKWLALHAISRRKKGTVIEISRLLRAGVGRTARSNTHLYTAVETLLEKGLVRRHIIGKSARHHYYAPTELGAKWAHRMYDIMQCPKPLILHPKHNTRWSDLPMHLPVQWLVIVFMYKQPTVLTSSMVDRMLSTSLYTEVTSAKSVGELAERKWYRNSERKPLLNTAGEGEVKVRVRSGMWSYEAEHFTGTFYQLNPLGEQAAETLIDFYRTLDEST